MGWTAGTTDEDENETTEAAENEAADATEAPRAGTGGSGSKRGIYLLVGGLVVAGIAAAWNWLRDLPKDE